MIFSINYLHIQAKKRFCDSSDCPVAALVFILSLLYLYNHTFPLQKFQVAPSAAWHTLSPTAYTNHGHSYVSISTLELLTIVPSAFA